jgi:hypothetical protein
LSDGVRFVVRERLDVTRVSSGKDWREDWGIVGVSCSVSFESCGNDDLKGWDIVLKCINLWLIQV